MYVGVYGTLMRGHCNHILLADAIFERVEIIPSSNNFKMVSLGPYPAIIPVKSKDSRQIYTEVYCISDKTLKVLDRLEGVPDLYQRISIQLFDISVWIYTMNNYPFYENIFPELTRKSGIKENNSIQKWVGGYNEDKSS